MSEIRTSKASKLALLNQMRNDLGRTWDAAFAADDIDQCETVMASIREVSRLIAAEWRGPRMSATLQAEQPGEGWTLSGIALVQLGQSVNDIREAMTAIVRQDEDAAHAVVQRVIRQLDTAARMLA